MTTPASPSTPPPLRLLVCLSGPDKAKRLDVRPEKATIGRGGECHLLSEDPDVAEKHLEVWIDGDSVRFQSGSGAAVFVDGVHSIEGVVEPGRQLRIGRSYWKLEDGAGASTPLATPGAGAGGVAAAVQPSSGPSPLAATGAWIASSFDRVTGTERLEGFKPTDVFSGAFRWHKDEAIESVFVVGTPGHEVPLDEINSRWPRPWLFVQTLLVTLLAYAGLRLCWALFHNVLMIPGLLALGALAVPLSVVVFFFEMNVPRNVSLYQVMKFFLLGGVLSLVISLFFFRWFDLSWLGAMSAGLIEESGKLLALLVVARHSRYPWTLNGMIFGAAVGAGFAAFESAGYAFVGGLAATPDGILITPGMFVSLLLRGVLTPGAHVVWTALVGAALWNVKRDRPFRFAMLMNPIFLRAFGTAVVLHMIWNSPLQLPVFGTPILLTIVAWIIVLRWIQRGLREVAAAQGSTATSPPAPPPAPA